MKKNTGLVKEILLVIVALIVLGYFGFDVRHIVESEQVQKNLDYGTAMVGKGWEYVQGRFKF